MSSKYLYKIAPAQPPVPIDSATSTFPKNTTMAASDLDTASGFIHLSTAAQVPGTLERFFASPRTDRQTVYLLKVPREVLEHRAGVLRWESPDAKVGGPRDGEGMFPHVYFADGRLGLSDAEVVGVVEIVSAPEEEGWTAALERVGKWLV